MVRTIVAYGVPALRRQTEEIDLDYPDLKQLVDDMFETMDKANGVGLAAPQIGLSIKLIVVDATPFAEEDPASAGFRRALINPEIYETGGESWAFNEGCLSFPGLHEDVMRPETVHIRYMDMDGNMHDEVHNRYVARILQHECDHLNGKTFVDRLSSLRRAFLRKKLDNITRGDVNVDYKMKFAFKTKHR